MSEAPYRLVLGGPLNLQLIPKPEDHPWGDLFVAPQDPENATLIQGFVYRPFEMHFQSSKESTDVIEVPMFAPLDMVCSPEFESHTFAIKSIFTRLLTKHPAGERNAITMDFESEPILGLPGTFRIKVTAKVYPTLTNGLLGMRPIEEVVNSAELCLSVSSQDRLGQINHLIQRLALETQRQLFSKASERLARAFLERYDSEPEAD